MRVLRTVLLVFLMALDALVPAIGVRAAETLAELLASARCSRFEVPERVELEQARRLFAGMLTPHRDEAALRSGWGTLGYDWILLKFAKEHVIALKEQAQHCRGRGFFLFRRHGKSQTFLQAPHRFHDRFTGTIVRLMLRRAEFRGAAWNTVPRRYRDEASAANPNADLAQLSDSYFTALAQTLTLILPQARVVQIHGFSTAKRDTPQGRNSLAIVSSGTRHPSVHARRMATCLAEALAGPVRLYGQTVSELGGTRNVTGWMLRSLGNTGFLHLELSEDARDRLMREPALLARTAQCLAKESP